MADSSRPTRGWWPRIGVLLAGVVGLFLLADSAWSSSATYDEVAYSRIGSDWWRTGKDAEMTRMGSPLLFFKLQQAPTLFLLDHLGHGDWIDEPIDHQAELLPWIRVGALWIWVVGLLGVAVWARALYGPRAMVFAAWLFALSPNILAHGALATMETPILASSVWVFYLFWRFLDKESKNGFWISAIVCGLAFSCKFTAVLFPVLLGFAWLGNVPWSAKQLGMVIRGICGFVAVMLLANSVFNGFATLPISTTQGGRHPSLEGKLGPFLAKVAVKAVETPIPQDWTGFLKQVQHQRSGGSSYLLGVRRMTGWKSYYLIAMGVKIPLACWILLMVRTSRPNLSESKMPIVLIIAFLVITSLGSSRNYGIRYLLPIAPLAIIWVSGLVELGGWRMIVACVGLAGQAYAIGSIHPHELTYFNELAGGSIGGRKILADSNLDWGQGLKSLARLQAKFPEYRDLTLYYFGDTEPRFYHVAGTCHVVDAIGGRPGLPTRLTADTKYLAVSASLQWGPWGPEGYFRRLNGVEPIAFTDDTTIAIYRTRNLPSELDQ